MNNKIIIVAGDPNSINSEIIYKSWTRTDNKTQKKLYLLGNYNLILKQFKKLNYKTNIVKVNSVNDSIKSTNLKIINISLNFKNPFKVGLRSSASYVIKCLNLAHSLAINKKVKGIINCPIDNKSFKKSWCYRIFCIKM